MTVVSGITTLKLSQLVAVLLAVVLPAAVLLVVGLLAVVLPAAVLRESVPEQTGSVPITGASRSPIQTGRQGRYAPQITFAEGLPRWTTRHVTAGIRSAPCMAVWRHMPSCSFEIGIGMPRVFAVRSAPCWCRRGPARRMRASARMPPRTCVGQQPWRKV